MNERQEAFLRVMKDAGESLGAGRIFYLAFPGAPHRGRRDAGATRTLDGLAREGLVTYTYTHGHPVSRDWRITEAGRAALRKLDHERIRGTVGQKGFGRSVVDAPVEMWEAHLAELSERRRIGDVPSENVEAALRGRIADPR